MGKKKSRNPETSTTQKYDAISAPLNISAAIFGDESEQDGTFSSIFSNSNPFKRKPQEKNSMITTIDASASKIRKRSKEERTTTDFNGEAEEVPVVIKKLKKEKTQKESVSEHSDSVIELNTVAKNDISNSGGDDLEMRRRTKKRKREELENKYDKNKYGVITDDVDAKEGELKGTFVGRKRKKADDEADMMISHEGFDDESKLLRTVFIGNLPLKVKTKVLMKEFSIFGEVESVRIRSVPLLNTKKPRIGAIMMKKLNEAVDSVNAYIVFKTEQAAEAALTHNMALYEGKHIRVDRACPPRKKIKGQAAPLYDNARTIFIGNLPFDVKDEEIYQLFSNANNTPETGIEAVRVIRDPATSYGKGIAYALFNTREAVNIIIRKQNLELRGRRLRLCRARQGSSVMPSSKRKNPSLPADFPAKRFEADSANGKKSYQGLRASKSGVEKKVNHRRGSLPVKMTVNEQGAEKMRERKGKRPAVAARRNKSETFKKGGFSKHAGGKRKMDSRTPQSSMQTKKKARKYSY